MPTLGNEKKISFKRSDGTGVSFFGRQRVPYKGTPEMLRQEMRMGGFADGFTNQAVAKVRERDEKLKPKRKPPARKRAKRN